MAKREKILIILVIAAAIVVFTLKMMDKKELSQAGNSDQEHVNEIDSFVEEQFNAMNQTGSLEMDETIIKKAVINWDHDPFAGSDLVKELEGEVEKENLTVSVEKKEIVPVEYSGYVKAGKKLLAIINGLEYKKGDIVEGTDYRILTITTKKILLRSSGSETRIVRLIDIFNPVYQTGNQ